VYVVCPLVADALHFISWEETGNVAAVLVVADPSPPCVWTNSRLIRGVALGLVDIWARRHIRRGASFEIIWEHDLNVLRE
jgi:hypothetical protein